MGAEGSSTGTVGKALGVLDLVASFEKPVKFSEVLARSDLPKGTAYRLIQNLVAEGMLAYDTRFQTYSLGMRLVRLAHVAWSQASLAPVARPILDRLSAEVGETIHLAQLDNAHVLYVDKRNAHRPVEMFSQAGKVGPAYCTGVGKAILAHLPQAELDHALQMQSYHRFTDNTLTSAEALRTDLAQIRAEGVSFDREEHEPGIICIAQPILHEGEHVMGALSITTTTARASLDSLRSYEPAMRRAARDIASAMRLWQFPTERTGGET